VLGSIKKTISRGRKKYDLEVHVMPQTVLLSGSLLFHREEEPPPIKEEAESSDSDAQVKRDDLYISLRAPVRSQIDCLLICQV